MSQHKLTINDDRRRFEMETEGYVSFIEFQNKNENVVVLTHTLVPPELGGRGIGKKLVELVLDHLKSNNRKVEAKCPFVSTYLERHPEWQSIIAGK